MDLLGHFLTTGMSCFTLAFHVYNVALRAFHLGQAGVLTATALTVVMVSPVCSLDNQRIP
jgi:hypothetical protein